MTAWVLEGGCGVEDQVSFWLDATAKDCSSRKQPLLHSYFNLDTHPFCPQWGFLSAIFIRYYSCAPNLENSARRSKVGSDRAFKTPLDWMIVDELNF
jgi:hypothetical protein